MTDETEERKDPEVEALMAILRLLNALEPTQRQRILDYLMRKYARDIAR